MTGIHDVVVIGGGLTGLSAAYHAAIRGAAVVCLEASGMHGGLVANVSALDDMPAQDGTPGIAFAEMLAQRCRASGVAFATATVTGIGASAAGLDVQTGDRTFSARKVIVASGAAIRRIGVPGERELEGRGVSTCAWCDGGLYRDQRVVVVGGGDSALQGALHLAGLCSAVDVVAQGDLTARRAYVLAAADRDTIAFHWDTRLISIDGVDGVAGITAEENGEATRIPCAAVFLYPGLSPTGAFVPPAVERDATGALVADPDGRTAMPHLFVAGAVRKGFAGQGVNALSEGALAAIAATGELDV